MLYTLAKTEDKIRLTTYADNQFWGRFMQLPTDVLGYNRYFGWYKDAGSAEKFGGWLDSYCGVKEQRPVCISEYGGGGAISQHKDNIDWENEIDPWGERHYENYQSEMHEKIWKQFAERRYLWGKFIWCMFDFSSDGRREGDTVGQNDKGMCTRERIRKDAFYFYKSVWNSESMVHITNKRFSPRPAAVPEMKVYSNAASVQLILNGEPLSAVSKNDNDIETVFVWNNITLKCGDNSVEAAAYFSDGSVLKDIVIWRAEG